MAVQCSACNQSWPRDPTLEVKCPSCPAGIGQHCVRPSGHNLFGNTFHTERDKLAMKTIPDYGLCPKRFDNEKHLRKSACQRQSFLA
jgi:hypothetical protein